MGIGGKSEKLPQHLHFLKRMEILLSQNMARNDVVMSQAPKGGGYLVLFAELLAGKRFVHFCLG